MARSPTIRLLLPIVVAIGCGRVPSKAQAPAKGQGVAPVAKQRPTFYIPGERMVFEIRWGRVLMGGLTLVVGQPGVVDGHEAIVVRTELRSDGMLAVIKEARAEMATMINLADGLAMSITGTFDALYSGDVLDDTYRGTPRNLPWKPYQRQLSGGAPAYETFSAFGMLRSWFGDVGESVHFYGKVNGQLFRTDVVSNGREVLKTEDGRETVLRLDGVVTPAMGDLTRSHSDEMYRWIMWLSEDDDRRLIRLHVQSGWGGTVRVDLVDYDAGSGT